MSVSNTNTIPNTKYKYGTSTHAGTVVHRSPLSAVVKEPTAERQKGRARRDARRKAYRTRSSCQPVAVNEAHLCSRPRPLHSPFPSSLFAEISYTLGVLGQAVSSPVCIHLCPKRCSSRTSHYRIFSPDRPLVTHPALYRQRDR